MNLFIHIANAFLVYFLMVLTFRTPYFNGQKSKVKGERSAIIRQESEDESRTIEPDASLSTLHVSQFIALFSALLFVAHPLQTQAVTYIVQRFASLATLFYLLSIVMYIKGRLISPGAESREQKAKDFESDTVLFFLNPMRLELGPMPFYVFSLLCAALAMRTKEIAYTLPMVIILYEFVFFTAPLKKKLLFLLPVVLVLIIVPLGVMHSDKPFGVMLSDIDAMTRVETEMSRWTYLMTEMRVVTTYVRLIILPINQNFDYDYPVYQSFFTPPVFLSFLFLSTLLAASGYLLYKARPGKAQRAQGMEREAGGIPLVPYAPYYRLIGFGVLWFFITLSVESSIIPIKDVLCEHRVYLPSVGFLTAIAAGVFAVAARFKKEKSAALILVLITLVLSAATYARNNVWKDAESLWENVVKKSPDLARAHTGLGAVYSRQGRKDEAMREFQTAVALNLSDYVAHYNIGIIYERQGQPEEARKEFKIAVSLKPDKPDIHNSLGIVYEQLGFPYDAIKEYQEVLRLDPYRDYARNRLEVLNKRTGTDNH